MSHSILINNILSKKEKENEFPIESIRKLEYGLIFYKYETKGKSERRLFCIQVDLFRIVWISGRDQIEGVINLRDIKEIRIGKPIDTKIEESKKLSLDQCFVIFYGKKFKLKELICFGEF